MQDSDEMISSFGNLLSGFGSNMVSGSLDVLESLGKTAFEKLTVSQEVIMF